MKLYVFASNDLTNIWAGVGAERWAVAPSKHAPSFKGRKTKAAKMPVGAFGILYCSETSSLTVPFVVYSKPNDSEEVSHVWPQTWVLPFSIKPLGTPHKQMSRAQAEAELPSLKGKKFDKLLHVRGDFAFQSSEITDEDWSVLIERLAA